MPQVWTIKDSAGRVVAKFMAASRLDVAKGAAHPLRRVSPERVPIVSADIRPRAGEGCRRSIGGSLALAPGLLTQRLLFQVDGSSLTA
jgi:hypothetical protein